MKKRAFFTLLEVLLSLSLFTIAFASLLFWYHTLTMQKMEETLLQKTTSLEKNTHRHLLKILPKVTSDVFYTIPGGLHIKGGSLVFTFDNGPNLEPLLSDKVLGRIYLDGGSSTLILGIWPWNKEEVLYEPSQQIPLLENVKEVAFSFFYPPDLLQKPVNPEKVGLPHPHIGWQSEWKKEFETLPALVKLTIKKHPSKEIKNSKSPVETQEEELILGYCLDPKIHPIIYTKTPGET